MFSGIVETTSPIVDIQKNGSVYHLYLKKPLEFQDLKMGDSVSVDGVCLTVEEFDSAMMRFSLAPETLRITKWEERLHVGQNMNLERSLKLNDRIHGHIVTGHVDTLATICEVKDNQESLFFSLEIPSEYKKFVWTKGSLCIRGISLTINQVENNILSFYLIPETLKRTNLKTIKTNDLINIEFDYLAKATVNMLEQRQ